MSGRGGTSVVKTIGGALAGFVGIVAMSVVAGVLVAASITPAIA
ncbi:hypothetical protein [Rathayibacter iranicus]|nr:hypothetical protein [Rathayibacter iranicus]